VADAVVAKSEQERRTLWGLREDLEAVLQADTVYLYDVGLPIRHMHDYVLRVEAGLRQRWPDSRCYTMGHIADGNVHFFVDPGCEGTSQAESDEEVYGPLQDYGGTVSAEHGIGFDKKTWLIRNRSPQELEVMRSLKRLFDPRGILNPGRVVDA
jgi:FAD/FMN-containing dehydrogenase